MSMERTENKTGQAELRDKNGMTEAEFLENYKTKTYPRPYVTADMAIFSEKGGDLYLLMVRRGGHPYMGKWALPGGFLNSNETIEECAARELCEETGVDGVAPVQVGVFSKPGRDPRGWVITVAYTAMVDMDHTKVAADDDAADARWFKVRARSAGGAEAHEGVPEGSEGVSQGSEGVVLEGGGESLYAGPGSSDLAFDHADIILKAWEIR